MAQGLPVQDVLLEQGEEGFMALSTRADPSIDHVVPVSAPTNFRLQKLRPSIGVQTARPARCAPGDSVVEGGDGEAGLHP